MSVSTSVCTLQSGENTNYMIRQTSKSSLAGEKAPRSGSLASETSELLHYHLKTCFSSSTKSRTLASGVRVPTCSPRAISTC